MTPELPAVLVGTLAVMLLWGIFGLVLCPGWRGDWWGEMVKRANRG